MSRNIGDPITFLRNLDTVREDLAHLVQCFRFIVEQYTTFNVKQKEDLSALEKDRSWTLLTLQKLFELYPTFIPRGSSSSE